MSFPQHLVIFLGASLLLSGSLAFFLRRALLESAALPVLSGYKSRLHRDLIFLRVSHSPWLIMVGQIVFFALGFFMLNRDLGYALASFVVCVAPPFLLRQMKHRRVQSIERQIEGWLGSLARALEAAPSLGEALEVSATMSDAPLSEELEVVLSEMHLGRPLDRALSAWGKRVGSRTLTLALATLQVGRATGGGLPEVLRSAGAALAELERLEGVIRTKTAEGKVQAWMVSLMPVPVYFGILLSDPHYFRPLEESAIGHVLLAVAVTFWIVAIFSARKILAVRV